MIYTIVLSIYACYILVTSILFISLRTDYYIAKRGFGPLLCTSVFQVVSLTTLCMKKEIQESFPCLFYYWGNNFAFPMFIFCAYVARGLSLLHENYWNRMRLQQFGKTAPTQQTSYMSTSPTNWQKARDSPSGSAIASRAMVATDGPGVAGRASISDDVSNEMNCDGQFSQPLPLSTSTTCQPPEQEIQAEFSSTQIPSPSAELAGKQAINCTEGKDGNSFNFTTTPSKSEHDLFGKKEDDSIPFFSLSQSIFRWFILKRYCAEYAILLAFLLHFCLNAVHNCIFFYRHPDEDPRLYICLKNDFSMNYFSVSFCALFLSPLVLYGLRGVEDAMRIKRDIRNSIFVGIPVHLYFIVIRNIKSLRYLKAYSPPVIVIFLWVSSFHTLMLVLPIVHVMRTRKRRGAKPLDSSAYPCITFDDVLSDSVLLVRFREFTVNEFSVENIFFWESLQQYKDIFLLVSKYSHDHVFDLASQFAKQMKETFFTAYSNYELNINYEYKRIVLDRIHCNKIHRDTFKEAERDVMLHLKTCTFPRFLKHLKEQMQKDKQNPV